MFTSALAFSLLALVGTTVLAEPFYIRQYQASSPSMKARQKALDQVKKHQDDLPIRDDLDNKLPTFHKRLAQKVKAGETFCQNCHLPVPHRKKLRSRAFLNMHSRYIACATCHFQPPGVTFEYRWLDYQSWQPAMPETPFRTGLDLDNANPIDGNYKIAPLFSGEPAIPAKNSAFAKTILQQWREGTPDQRADLKARLHAPLRKQGPGCSACHTDSDPKLDLKALGASDEQVDLIHFHRIPSFFSRYQSDDERLRIIGILR